MKPFIRLRDLKIVSSLTELANIPAGKTLINTINAYSYNMARKDEAFAAALKGGDYLIPDGVAVVKACKFLNGKSKPSERIAGWDLFSMEMERLGKSGGKVMFMGSSESVLSKIRQRCTEEFPSLFVDTYSPPFKPVFSEDDDKAIINAINASNPDLLWIGMTAPKQEKWIFAHWDELDIHCHAGSIGAVFDFFAGTVQRAPLGWQKHGFEWLYRLLKEPRRMWRRYLIGNAEFLLNVTKEKFCQREQA